MNRVAPRRICGGGERRAGGHDGPGVCVAGTDARVHDGGGGRGGEGARARARTGGYAADGATRAHRSPVRHPPRPSRIEIVHLRRTTRGSTPSPRRADGATGEGSETSTTPALERYSDEEVAREQTADREPDGVHGRHRRAELNMVADEGPTSRGSAFNRA